MYGELDQRNLLIYKRYREPEIIQMRSRARPVS